MVSIKKTLFCLQIVMNIVAMIFTLIIPMIEGNIINILVNKEGDKLFFQIYILLLIFILQMLFSFISSKVVYYLLPNNLIEMQNQSLDFFIDKSALTIKKYDLFYIHERLSSDVEKIFMFYYTILPNVICEGIYIIVVLGVLCFCSTYFVILFIVLVLLYSSIYIVTNTKLSDIIEQLLESENKLYSRRTSSFQRIIDIKAKETINYENKSLKLCAKELKKMRSKNFLYQYFISSAKIVLSFVSQLLFFMIGGLMIISGRLSMGYFMAIMQYFLKLIASLDGMMSFASSYREFKVSRNRMRELEGLDEDTDGNQLIGSISKIEISSLNINNLYKNSLNYIFSRGNVYQLDGKNGVGKTTLLYSILGVYKNVYKGIIRLNDVNIENLNMRIVREKSSSVMIQNEFSEDILVRDFLIKFISFEYLEELLDKNPTFNSAFCGSKFNVRKYYNNRMGELSGGERQIIQLLVCLSKPNASLIILDESFSNINSNFDENISNLLNELCKSAIIIIVSHRKIENLNPIMLEIE